MNDNRNTLTPFTSTAITSASDPSQNNEKKIFRDPIAISASEAATLLGVSKPTIYTLMRRTDFPSFKIGARSLISLDGLRLWVNAQAGGVYNG